MDSLQQQAEALVAQTETHIAQRGHGPSKGSTHLTAEDIADILFWNRKGLTQEQIAAKFVPPKHQSTISRCLAEWGHDRTAEAKRMVRAAGPRLVKDIVDGEDLKTKALLLKGSGVLEEQQQHVLNILVGGGSAVTFAPSASVVGQVMHSLTTDTGSDNSELC